jgi:hypothetical protein
MSKSSFRILLTGFVFASNAKVTKLLKSEKSTDAELAAAVKSTKAYKEDKNLQTVVSEVIAKAIGTSAPEPLKSKTAKEGEPLYRRRNW